MSQFSLFWNIVSIINGHIFKQEIKKKKKKNLVNIILNFARLIIYRNVIKERYEEKKTPNAFKMFVKRIKNRSWICSHLKFNQKKYYRN